MCGGMGGGVCNEYNEIDVRGKTSQAFRPYMEHLKIIIERREFYFYTQCKNKYQIHMKVALGIFLYFFNKSHPEERLSGKTDVSRGFLHISLIAWFTN